MSFGELRTSFDPKISECENPRRDYLPGVAEYIGNVSEPAELKHLSKQRKRKQ